MLGHQTFLKYILLLKELPYSLSYEKQDYTFYWFLPWLWIVKELSSLQYGGGRAFPKTEYQIFPEMT